MAQQSRGRNQNGQGNRVGWRCLALMRDVTGQDATNVTKGIATNRAIGRYE